MNIREKDLQGKMYNPQKNDEGEFQIRTNEEQEALWRSKNSDGSREEQQGKLSSGHNMEILVGK